MTDFKFADSPTPYILAGAQTLDNVLSPLLEYTTEETINKVLLDTMDKLLITFGANLNYKNKKLSPKYLQRFMPHMKFVDNPMFKNMITYIDSGGFQIANGAVDPKDIPRFTDYYIELIKNHGDFVFTMDVPPTEDPHESYDEVYKKNKYTYDRLAGLDDNIMDKLLCVYHFRTTKIYETWNRLFEEGDYFNKFKIWSVGVLVGFGTLASRAGIVPYIIPIAKLIKTTKDRGLKQVYIHILGSTAPNDMLLYILLKKLIKDTMDIDLYMTFDSSKIYKGIINSILRVLKIKK